MLHSKGIKTLTQEIRVHILLLTDNFIIFNLDPALILSRQTPTMLAIMESFSVNVSIVHKHFAKLQNGVTNYTLACNCTAFFQNKVLGIDFEAVA